MGVARRLRELDDRVFGEPRPATTSTYQTLFLVGLVGTLTVLAAVLITGDGLWAAAGGGFLGTMLVSGARWYAMARSSGR